jgi:hypothetical protein
MVAVAVAIVLLSGFLERTRTKALSNVAHQIGLTFEGEEWSRGTHAPQLETRHFEAKRGEQLRNIMSGKRAGLDSSFFDYSYQSGKRSSTHQTVATFSQDIWLPKFEIAPQDVLHKLSDKILHKVLHFESHPEFSKRFRVLSVDAQKAHELFAPGLLSFLDSLNPKAGWHIEGSGLTLLMYRSGRKVKPGEFLGFIEETTEMAKTFFNLAGLKKSSK